MRERSKLEVVHDNIHALPLIETESMDSLLSEREALKVWGELQELPSTTRERIHAQVESVEYDLITKLNYDETADKFVLSHNELRYVLSRMAITAAAQEAIDIGHVLKESSFIKAIVEGPEANAYDDEGQQPLGGQPNDQS